MDVNHNRNQKVEPVHINSKYLEPARYWVINDHMINDHVVEKYFPKNNTSSRIILKYQSPFVEKNRLYKIPRALITEQQ